MRKKLTKRARFKKRKSWAARRDLMKAAGILNEHPIEHCIICGGNSDHQAVYISEGSEKMKVLDNAQRAFQYGICKSCQKKSNTVDIEDALIRRHLES